jgi:hypothetical protein
MPAATRSATKRSGSPTLSQLPEKREKLSATKLQQKSDETDEKPLEKEQYKFTGVKVVLLDIGLQWSPQC